MRTTTFTLMAGLVMILGVTLAPSSTVAAMTIDNYESYNAGTIIGPSAQSDSAPYRRFGTGTVSNVYSTSNDSDMVIAGQRSGRYKIDTDDSFAITRYNYDQVNGQDLDLSDFSAVSVAMYADIAASNVQVQLNIDSTGGSGSTDTSYALTNTAQTFSFDLSEVEDDVNLEQINDIGFRFTTAAGSTTAEQDVYFDDFQAVPEPASAALFGIGSLMLVPRRRRR